MIGNNTPAFSFDASPAGVTAAYGLSGLIESKLSFPANELPVGEIVSGRYRILSKIGQGGMGVVYQVEQVFLNKILALKTLETAGNSETAVRRFQIEARTAFAIDHPNLISVHDFGLLENKIPFLVMDYIQGVTLAERLSQDGTLEFAEALPLFVRICFGLSYAHSKGVIHRDIKPSNIMLVDEFENSPDDRVRIVDFGIAKFTQTETSQIQALTRTGEVFGSPLYMSPEQCMGNTVDQRADIYSLGCVFFETLTGTPPFVGANALSTMMQHLGEKPPTLKEASMGRDFPSELEQIVAKMLAKNVAERYQNMAHVTADLGLIIQRLGVSKASLFDVRIEQKVDASHVSPKVSHSRPKRLWAAVACGKKHSVSALQLFALAFGSAFLAAVATTISLNPVNQQPVSDELVIKPTAAVQMETSLKSKSHPLGVSFFTPLYELISYERFEEKLALSRGGRRFKLRAVKLPMGAFESLGRVKNIDTVDLLGCLFDSSKLGNLKGMTALEHLTLSQSNLTDEGVPGLLQVTSLNDLEVSWTNLTPAGIARLCALPKLERLEMSGMTVTEHLLRAFAASRPLKGLCLRSTKGLTDKNIQLLEKSQLNALNIESTDITDSGLAVIARMPEMSFLSVGRSKVSIRGIKKLLRSGRLKTLYYEPSALTPEKDMFALAAQYPRVHFSNVLKGDKPFWKTGI